jgi:formamidopyrimidine-DNA glycosylase
MPELPEVETVRRAMQAELEGDTIESVTAHREGLRTPFPADLAGRLVSQRIQSVGRRAKYILVHLKSGEIFVLHLGMSGRIILHPRGKHETAAKHDHLELETKKGVQMIFRDPRRFGMAFLVAEGQLDVHPAFRDLGPEPLGNAFSGPVLAAALRYKKTAIKLALLDQHVVAGIGNIYACEALYESGIDPRKASLNIKGAKAERLAAAIKKVLLAAINSGGSSLRDYRHTNGDSGYFQHHFSVYDREGKSCPDCTCDVAKTGGIVRFAQGGRSTFCCPRRQK